jgi:low temperature requirement protein LtrA
MTLAVAQPPDAQRAVSPLELFFDLVYVFAITQVSHHLLEHVDLVTGVETVILALAVFHAWYMTAWGANWLDPDQLPVRVVFVGLMFASLLMSAGIADAFDGRAWLFVTGYLGLQVGRSACVIKALHGRSLGEHFVNVLVWELLTGALWVAGAIAAEDVRIVLWALAVAGAYGSALALHWLPGRGRVIDLRDAEIAVGLIIERFRLFFIILLGDTVLTMGNAFVAKPFALERLVALAIGFTATVALWWCYFQRNEAIGAAAETPEGAGAIGWWGTWTSTLIVLGVIAISIADEMAIAGPRDDATLGFTILAFGGPALFLLAQVLFAAGALGHVPRSRLLGLAALAVLAVTSAPFTVIAGIATSTAVLVAIAIADTVRDRDQRPGRSA